MPFRSPCGKLHWGHALLSSVPRTPYIISYFIIDAAMKYYDRAQFGRARTPGDPQRFHNVNSLVWRCGRPVARVCRGRRERGRGGGRARTEEGGAFDRRMDGIVGKVSALGPSGWQCGKSFSEVPCWNRIEAVSQMKTPWQVDFEVYKPCALCYNAHSI